MGSPQAWGGEDTSGEERGSKRKKNNSSFCCISLVLNRLTACGSKSGRRFIQAGCMSGHGPRLTHMKTEAGKVDVLPCASTPKMHMNTHGVHFHFALCSQKWKVLHVRLWGFTCGEVALNDLPRPNFLKWWPCIKLLKVTRCFTSPIRNDIGRFFIPAQTHRIPM